MNSGIYTIENTIDCKLYVGYTKDFHKRRRCHWSELERGVHANDHLQRAVNLYGIDKFKFEILEEWSEDMLVCMEHWWCMMLNVHNDKYGYNINITHPHKKYASMSEQAKRRSSEKQKGREFTQEHKDRIREKRKSQVITEQHKQRTRQTILGRKDTDEVRRYKSEVAKKRGVSQAFRDICKKPIEQYTKDGVLIAEYGSMTEAERKTGIKSGTMKRHCDGKVKKITSHVKYVWKWKK